VIKLKVKQKGYFLEIPGFLPVRTPTEIDITNGNIPLIISYLKKNGIVQYQIISENEKTKEKEIIQEVNLAEKKGKLTIDKKINKLENLLMKFIEKQSEKTVDNSEQITKKLEKLEVLTEKLLSKQIVSPIKETKEIKKENKKPDIEELGLQFIPEIDIKNIEVKGNSNQEIIEQEKDDLDDKVDLLSRLIGEK